MSTKKLGGKTAIITGSSYGIGKGIALLFAQEGANIVINYSKSLEKAQQVVSEESKTPSIADRLAVGGRTAIFWSRFERCVSSDG